jgi:hypothetical protein
VHIVYGDRRCGVGLTQADFISVLGILHMYRLDALTSTEIFTVMNLKHDALQRKLSI